MSSLLAAAGKREVAAMSAVAPSMQRLASTLSSSPSPPGQAQERSRKNLREGLAQREERALLTTAFSFHRHASAAAAASVRQTTRNMIPTPALFSSSSSSGGVGSRAGGRLPGGMILASPLMTASRRGMATASPQPTPKELEADEKEYIKSASHFKLSTAPHPLRTHDSKEKKTRVETAAMQAGNVAPATGDAPAERVDFYQEKDEEAHIPKGLCHLEWSGYENPVWSAEETNAVKVTHKQPEDFSDRVALGLVRVLRTSFDYIAGFKTGPVSEDKYLLRCIILETVAGIPGMVAGSIRHLQSLRSMKRDHGWIHTLLEEAENERMHLLTFLKLKRPGPLMRFSVLVAQGVGWNVLFFLYLMNPKIVHRTVGYIEEEAVHTYTVLLEDIDNGKLPLFENLDAPMISKNYWKLGEDAKFRELILSIRADEANHRLVNHTFADLHANFKENDVNPFLIHETVEKHEKSTVEQSDGRVSDPLTSGKAGNKAQTGSVEPQK